MLEFVDSGLFFFQDENNFKNPFLQVESRSGSIEKSTGSESSGPKINGSDQIQILIPDRKRSNLYTNYHSEITIHHVCSHTVRWPISETT